LKNGNIFTQGDTAEVFTDEVFQELLGYPVHIYRESDDTYRLRLSTESNIAALMERGEEV